MLDDELVIQRPKLTKYQKDILYAPERFTVTTAATKVGKTFSHLWWLFEKATEFDQTHFESSKTGHFWWVAPVYSQAKIAFERLKRVVKQCDYRINETELFIELDGGTKIWFKSADKPDNLYGEDVYAVVFDEFTRAKEQAWIALRSTLTDTKGVCKFIGNAKGKKNWGAKLAAKARSGEANYKFFKVTAYDAVEAGILELDEIEQAKRDLPKHAFDALYLAIENEDQANPFGITFIRNAIRPISSKPPVCFGIDLAKSVDWTVVTGLDEDGFVCLFERWQSDWGQTKRRIISIVGDLPALMDSTGVGDPILEDVQKECYRVEGFHFSQPSKQKLMEGLTADVQKGETSILAGVMQDEAESFEYIYTRTGVKYSAPEGLHDDTVYSLALARKIFNNKPSTPTFSIIQ